MHVSAQSFRPPFEAYSTRLPEIEFLRPVLATAVVALLAVGGALLLSANGFVPPGPGLEDPAAYGLG